MSIDLPVILIAILVLGWIAALRSKLQFLLGCFFFSTFGAGYSLGVHWSLAKVLPLVMAITYMRTPMKIGANFTPSIAYIALSMITFSLFWPIPQDIPFFYGEGRILTQLISLASLVFATRNLIYAFMREQGSVVMLWKTLILISFVNGLAIIYQYLTLITGLPQFSFNIAHGNTYGIDTLAVAAFTFEESSILRPAGFMGEPKTVSIFFSLTLMLALLGPPKGLSKHWHLVFMLTIILSVIGFIGGFSTSAFLGLAVAWAMLRTLGIVRNKLKIIALYIALFGVAMNFTHTLGLDLAAMIIERTTKRLSEGALSDGPVEAAINIFAESPTILLFGTGLGGDSFYIARNLGVISGFVSFSPNIGFIYWLLNVGVVGLSLYLIPFAQLTFRVLKLIHRFPDLWTLRFLLVVAITLLVIGMVGSGFTLLLPLATTSLLVAFHITVNKHAVTNRISTEERCAV